MVRVRYFQSIRTPEMTAEMGTKRDEGALTWNSRLAGVEVVYHKGAAGHLVMRRSGVGHMGG